MYYGEIDINIIQHYCSRTISYFEIITITIESEREMFVVQFNRKDGDVEKYYYHRVEDAQYHLDLFEEDDSELYESIEIVEET